MQQVSVAVSQVLTFILGNVRNIGLKLTGKPIAAVRGVDEEAANTFDITTVRAPSGPQLVDQAARLPLGMNGGKDRFASTDVVVELASNVEGIMTDEQDVVGLVHGSESFLLWQKSS
jgi:hypothetical protein